MNRSLSYKSLSPFLPEIDVPLFVTTVEPNLREQLLTLCVSYLPRMMQVTDGNKIPPGEDVAPPAEWATNRGWQYNIFDLDETHISKLRTKISQSYKEYCVSNEIEPEPVYIHGWLNECPKGTIIHPHNHEHVTKEGGMIPSEFCYVSGSFCVRTERTTTNFKNPFIRTWIKVPNENGMLYLFPSYIVHDTSPNDNEETRITLAFDIITKTVYDMDQENYQKIFCPL